MVLGLQYQCKRWLSGSASVVLGSVVPVQAPLFAVSASVVLGSVVPVQAPLFAGSASVVLVSVVPVQALAIGISISGSWLYSPSASASVCGINILLSNSSLI